MKSKLAALFVAGAILMASGYHCCAKSLLRFDGLYRRPAESGSSEEKPATYYLRFYPDGVVLVVASTGTPKDLVLWFQRGHAPSFKYSVVGNSIRFEESTESGDVWYRGTAYRGYLDLDIRGRLRWSGRRINLGKHRYDFVPLEIAP